MVKPVSNHRRMTLPAALAAARIDQGPLILMVWSKVRGIAAHAMNCVTGTEARRRHDTVATLEAPLGLDVTTALSSPQNRHTWTLPSSAPNLMTVAVYLHPLTSTCQAAPK